MTQQLTPTETVSWLRRNIAERATTKWMGWATVDGYA